MELIMPTFKLHLSCFLLKYYTIKLILRSIKHHTMKTYWGVKV